MSDDLAVTAIALEMFDLCFRKIVINNCLRELLCFMMQHKLNVLAIDGGEIEPEETDYVIIHSGERYDVEVLSNAPVGNYWIRIEDLASQDIAGVLKKI